MKNSIYLVFGVLVFLSFVFLVGCGESSDSLDSPEFQRDGDSDISSEDDENVADALSRELGIDINDDG